MATIFKCKMCGGDLNITENASVFECIYCGTYQTVPILDDEKKIRMFERANHLRFTNEFDSAASVFENIAAEFPEEAEAYWGLCLCKYGIEYVDDPGTGKKKPTCHRTNYYSILDDDDYIQAYENAATSAKQVYRSEAREIDRIQKSILEIAKNEKPFDVFICYKETADDGQRTKDSVFAQDIYNALTEKRYKVFFSRITLESKLGQAYEPYIFSALTSSRVMLVVGTDYDNFNAVWVKNEWSRYLKMLHEDKSKTIYLCYADIDPDDTPREFNNVTKLNMRNVGFLQDLVRGIGKIIQLEKDNLENTQQVSGPSVENLLKRGLTSVDYGRWEEAEQCFDKVLDEDAESSQAYLGKVLTRYKVNHIEQLVRIRELSNNPDFKRAIQFSNGKDKEKYLSVQNANVDFFREEERRAKIVIGAVENQRSRINELEFALENTKNQCEEQIDKLQEKRPRFITRKGCMIPFFIVVFFAGYIIRLAVYQGELDTKAGGSAVLVGFIASVSALILVEVFGWIIHINSCNRKMKRLDRAATKQEQNILSTIQTEKNNYICYCCGTITNTKPDVCNICGCTQMMQIGVALSMERNEFAQNVVSDSVIPQNHDFMK